MFEEDLSRLSNDELLSLVVETHVTALQAKDKLRKLVAEHPDLTTRFPDLQVELAFYESEDGLHGSEGELWADTGDTAVRPRHRRDVSVPGS